MKNLKIVFKITIGFGLVLLCTLILSLAVIFSGQSTQSQLNAIEALSDFQVDTNSFINHFDDARIGARVMLNTHSVPQYERAVKSYNQAEVTLRDLLARTASSPTLSHHQALVNDILTDSTKWMALVNELHASNQLLDNMRKQFAGMISHAAMQAQANILDAQLDNLLNDIEESSDKETMLRRHARIDHAGDIMIEIQKIEDVFNPLISFHDLSTLTEATAYGAEVMASLNLYIEESHQQYIRDDAQAIFDELVLYFGLVDDYVAEIENNNRIKDMYEIHNAETVNAVTAVFNSVNDSVTLNINQALDLTDMLLTLSVILTILAVAAGLIVAVYLARSLSEPLTVLTNFMERAGTVGDIAILPEDEAIINKYSDHKDEIGSLIRSTAGYIGGLNREMDLLRQIADGDLTIKPDVLSEKDTVGRSLLKVVDGLNDMFGEIQTSTGQVSTGARQVADGSQMLAQGATEQAASIQELSVSIAEIAERTKTNAQIAGKTAKLSATIRANAEKGSGQMDEMIKAVGDINEASKNINKIIKTIDDIAFQTNILALNAAVEAARAGQHGKGFAVVAEEVRNLASKSAEAAKDTGVMIQNSMEKSEYGTRIAGETASSLLDIVSGIKESTNLVDEIAKSSGEQSDGIAQINIGIDQVAKVVQQNSATAEESAAVSEEMNGQADMLQQLIAQFRLRDDNTARRLPQPSRASLKPPVNRIAAQTGNNYAYSGAENDYGKY